jgi:hypothetical protein
MAHLRRWAGRNGPFDDDVTIVAIDRRRIQPAASPAAGEDA